MNMLQDTKAFASFSVDDLEKARTFYSDTLGIKVTKDDRLDILTLHIEGTNGVMVYAKPNHEPATFTVMHFIVEDLEKRVEELTNKGITLEHYTGEMATNEKGIFKGDSGEQLAWFTDPAGNVIGLVQEK